VLAADVFMGHEANPASPNAVGQDAMVTHFCDHFFGIQPRRRDVKYKDVGLNSLGIDVGAGYRGQALSEQPCVGMILSKARAHFLECDNSCCGQDTGLPHSSSEHSAQRDGPIYKRPRTKEQRTYWRSKTL